MILQALHGLCDWTWVVTAVIAALTYLFGSLVVKRRGLPPGPPPLPIIGNLSVFLTKTNINEHVLKWRAKYGDVFTVWLGPDPMVVICGWDRIKEGFITMKNTFNGRRVRMTGQLFLQGHDDLIFSDYGRSWEVQRKLVALAVRKYSISENLAILIDDVINQVVPLLLNKEGQFDPKDYIYFTIYNILASTAFGKRYTIDDEEFNELKNANDQMNDEINLGTILDIYPVLRHVPLVGSHIEKRMDYLIRRFQKPLGKQYQTHKDTYKQGTIRDFTDACLAAKEEALLEDNDNAQYFTDGNMINVLFDLFAAGTDTTRLTLTWILLYLCKYPEMQDKVRAEILEKIGTDNMPVQTDRLKCSYTIAVITETLRVRPIISFSLEHKAIQDADFAGYKIPKDTSVVFHMLSQHMDPAYFKDPEVFRPERFLEEDGSFMTNTRFAGYLPFGIGRRACPGEKLALADLFLVLAGLIRKVRFSLPGGPDTVDLEPVNLLSVHVPKPFNMKVEKV